MDGVMHLNINGTEEISSYQDQIQQDSSPPAAKVPRLTSLVLEEHNYSAGARNLHQCYYCPEGFDSKCELDLHTKTHTAVSEVRALPDRYACDRCPKSFYWKCQLNRHLLIHTEGLHKCNLLPTCTARFNRYDNFIRHQKTVHREMFYDSEGAVFASSSRGSSTNRSRTFNHSSAGRKRKCTENNTRGSAVNETCVSSMHDSSSASTDSSDTSSFLNTTHLSTPGQELTVMESGNTDNDAHQVFMDFHIANSQTGQSTQNYHQDGNSQAGQYQDNGEPIVPHEQQISPVLGHQAGQINSTSSAVPFVMCDVSDISWSQGGQQVQPNLHENTSESMKEERNATNAIPPLPVSNTTAENNDQRKTTAAMLRQFVPELFLALLAWVFYILTSAFKYLLDF